jgi:hypothetical protein
MMQTVRALHLLVLGAALQGCATTPREAVELSVTVGRDIEEVHAAHVALAKQYFDRMEKDVNAFVDGTYRPYSIRQNMKDFRLVEKISDPSKADGLDALKVTELFVKGAHEGHRGLPFGAPRPHPRAAPEGADIARGGIPEDPGRSLHWTGHLASIVKVHEAQDEVLAKAELAGFRERLVDATAKASDQIADLTRNAELARGKADEIEKTIENLEEGDGVAREEVTRRSVMPTTEEEALQKQQEELDAIMEKNRIAFAGIYGKQIRGLLGLSKDEVAAITLNVTSDDVYAHLIDVVKDASAKNISAAELKQRIEGLGRAAVASPKKVAAFAGRFT